MGNATVRWVSSRAIASKWPGKKRQDTKMRIEEAETALAADFADYADWKTTRRRRIAETNRLGKGIGQLSDHSS